jgi:maleate isomerase
MIVPSSNTALEPIVAAMARHAPFIAHFTRVRVRTLADTDEARAQFSHDHLLEAARLLADAGVDAVAWAGTSGLWLGLSDDQRLCDRIQRTLGCPATTSALAVIEALHCSGGRRVGVAVPYTASIERGIQQGLVSEGFEIAVSNRLDLERNADIGRLGARDIERLVSACCQHDSDVIATICTNVDSASLTGELEQRHPQLVVDSVSATVWMCLQILGVSSQGLVPGWGRIFGLGANEGEVRHG